MQIRNIKQAARRSLQDSNRNPMALTFLFVLCLNAPYILYHTLDTVLFFGMDTSPTGIGGFNAYAAYLAFTTIMTAAIGVFAGIWQCCYQNYTLNVSRGKEVSFRDFTAPLRIAGKVFWLNLLIALYTALWALAFYFPVTFIASFFASDLIISLLQDPEAMPVITAIIMIPGYLMAYRYRLSFLVLFDHEEWRASEAINCSKRLTNGYKRKLFRMDLSFFWYYAALAAVTAIGNADLWLPMFGVTLPMSADVAYFVFYAVFLVLQFGIYYFLRNRVEVSYALAYDAVKPEEPKDTGVVLGNIFQM